MSSRGPIWGSMVSGAWSCCQEGKNMICFFDLRPWSDCLVAIRSPCYSYCCQQKHMAERDNMGTSASASASAFISSATSVTTATSNQMLDVCEVEVWIALSNLGLLPSYDQDPMVIFKTSSRKPPLTQHGGYLSMRTHTHTPPKQPWKLIRGPT